MIPDLEMDSAIMDSIVTLLLGSTEYFRTCGTGNYLYSFNIDAEM